MTRTVLRNRCRVCRAPSPLTSLIVCRDAEDRWVLLCQRCRDKLVADRTGLDAGRS